MDLVRAILLEVEAMDFSGSIPQLVLEDWDGHLVYEHAVLLKQADFLRVEFTMGNPPGTLVTGLTWEGHDFLDSIRDDSTWAAVKKQLAKVGGSAPLDLIKPLATQYLRSKLGLPEE